MIESIFIGSGFAFAAAVQPGPLQAFLLSKVAQSGWRRTLPASLAPLLSDIPIALLMLFFLNNISTAIYGVLKVSGGILLLYYAYLSYRKWSDESSELSASQDSGPRTFFQAALVNILNPNPYLGWSLVLGPAILTAWHRDPADGLALVLAFYVTMVTTLACIIILFGTTRFLTSKGHRILILSSSVLLAGMGIYQIITGLIK